MNGQGEREKCCIEWAYEKRQKSRSMRKLARFAKTCLTNEKG